MAYVLCKYIRKIQTRMIVAISSFCVCFAVQVVDNSTFRILFNSQYDDEPKLLLAYRISSIIIAPLGFYMVMKFSIGVASCHKCLVLM